MPTAMVASMASTGNTITAVLDLNGTTGNTNTRTLTTTPTVSGGTSPLTFTLRRQLRKRWRRDVGLGYVW